MSLIAEELFDAYTVTDPIDALNGGTGWYNAWQIQDDGPGYNVEAPLTYAGLLGSGEGGSLHGGDVFKTGGRGLYSSAQQPAIFYFAFLFTRESANESFTAALHNGEFAELFYLGDPIGISLSSGNICLLLGETNTSTGVTFATETTFLAVFKIEYAAGDVTVSLFIDPDISSEPGSPDATDTMTHAGIRNFTVGLGYYTDANRGANIGAVRAGTTWADVVPSDAPAATDIDGESDGSLATSGAISATVNAIAAVACSLAITGALSGYVQAVGSAAGSLATTSSISARVNAAGTLAGSLATTGALTAVPGAIAGVASCSLSAAAAISATANLTGLSACTLATEGEFYSDAAPTGPPEASASWAASSTSIVSASWATSTSAPIVSSSWAS